MKKAFKSVLELQLALVRQISEGAYKHLTVAQVTQEGFVAAINEYHAIKYA